MPIYEFYCSDCHTLFSFRSRRIDTKTRPDCPRCHRAELERRVSVVAIARQRAGRSEGSEAGDHAGPDPFAGMDESRMEHALESLVKESEGLDESDPRNAAQLMRRFLDATGMQRGPAMEEAIRRLEAGEDSDAIDSELGAALEAEAEQLLPTTVAPGTALNRIRRQLPPRVDETLYDM